MGGDRLAPSVARAAGRSPSPSAAKTAAEQSRKSKAPSKRYTADFDAAATRTSFPGGSSTKQLETGVKESMSLIDRFYNGGNRARPAALERARIAADRWRWRCRGAFSLMPYGYVRH